VDTVEQDIELDKVDQKQSLGEQLRAAREAKEWSLDVVANQLHLSRQRIIDLESDNYKYVSAETYAKGYLRAYARLLGLSIDGVLAAFDAMNLGDHIVSLRPKLLHQDGIETKSTHWILYGLFGVVALIAIIWLSSTNLDTTTSAQNVINSIVTQSVQLQDTAKDLPEETTLSSVQAHPVHEEITTY